MLVSAALTKAKWTGRDATCASWAPMARWISTDGWPPLPVHRSRMRAAMSTSAIVRSASLRRRITASARLPAAWTSGAPPTAWPAKRCGPTSAAARSRTGFISAESSSASSASSALATVAPAAAAASRAAPARSKVAAIASPWVRAPAPSSWSRAAANAAMWPSMPASDAVARSAPPAARSLAGCRRRAARACMDCGAAEWLVLSRNASGDAVASSTSAATALPNRSWMRRMSSSRTKSPLLTTAAANEATLPLCIARSNGSASDAVGSPEPCFGSLPWPWP